MKVERRKITITLETKEINNPMFSGRNVQKLKRGWSPRTEEQRKEVKMRPLV